MKRLIFLLMILLIVPMGFEAATYITTNQYATISSLVADSNYHSSNTADSVRIRVTFKGSECFDAWYHAGDAEADSSDGVLSWFDQYGDIDADSGNGTYQITASFYDATLDLYEHKYQWFIIGVDMADLAIIKDTGQASKDLLDDRENWNLAGRDKIGDTIARAAAVPSDAMTLTPGERAAIEDSIYAQRADYMADVSALTYFDTLIYIGPRGLGIYLDSAAGNTNTVIGTDGTVNNPVSTLIAARTLSDALGVKRYYFLNASTFLGATVDLATDHQNFEFIGVGHGSELAFGAQRVDNSRFEHLGLSGAMHASGGDVFYEYCTFGYITANFNGHADNCWLTDTIVVKAGKDIEFTHCHSGVAGNETPTIDFSGGSSGMSMRHYSGGIRILNGTSNDTISVETDGQLIIDASNTSLTVTARGMMTITDNGTTTNLTKDAVFSRQESGQWVPADTNRSGEVLGTMPDNWSAPDSAGFQGPGSSLTKEQVAQATLDSIRNASPPLPATPDDTTISGDQIGTMPDNWSAPDSAGFQGPGSSLTKEQVAQATLDSIRNASPALPATPVDTTESGDQVGTMPDDWTGADSAGFQGPGSSLTKEQVAQATLDSIRNASPALPATPVDTTESGDQVGTMPDDWTAADSLGFQGPGSTGSGPLSFTIFAEDSTTNDTLSGIPIFLFNQAGTETYGGQTDFTGSVTFNVTAGTWLARAALSSIMWAFEDTTYTVSLDFDSVAILGYPLVIPTPSNPDLGAVYGYLKTIWGLPAPGVIVTAESVTKMNVASTSNGFTIGDNVATDTTDANGLFSFPLIRTVVMVDSSRALYRIIGKRERKTKFIVDTLTVPPTGNVDISDKIGALY